MMVWSINLLVLAVGFLIVGMIKPRWILFWMDKPGRLPIIMLSTVLFMAAATMFGQANLEKHKELAKINEQPGQSKVNAVPTVAVKPVIETK